MFSGGKENIICIWLNNASIHTFECRDIFLEDLSKATEINIFEDQNSKAFFENYMVLFKI